MDVTMTSTRRKVLKTLGGALTASGLVGQAASQPSPREIYKQGLKILDRTGDKELFEQYILNRGFKIVQQNSETAPLEHGEVSTKHAEPNDLTLTASVYSHVTGSPSYAHGLWNANKDTGDTWNDFTDAGVAPKDVIGIGWEHTDYDIKWGTWESSSYVSQRKRWSHPVGRGSGRSPSPT